MGIRDGKFRTLVCKYCDQEKPIVLFRKRENARYRDDRRQPCKKCDYAQSKEWRRRNLERTREQLAEQYYRDPIRVLERHKEWSHKNRELVNEVALERQRRMRRGQVYWQRTEAGVLIGRRTTPYRDRSYIKERMERKP